MPRNPLWDELAWQGPHPGYVGGMLEAQPILLREPNIVAFVTNVRAYPQGLLFEVVLEQAVDDGTLRADGRFHSKPQVWADEQALHLHGQHDVSVQFADGSGWTTDEDRVTGSLIELGHSRSSGDGGASWSAEYWLPALPPPGPVTFLVELPDHTGHGTIEGGDIRAAAARAIDLWS